MKCINICLMRVSYDITFPLSCIPQEKRKHSNKNLNKNVHSSIIHNSKEDETTQIIHKLMTGQTSGIYIYHRIFSHKKEWSIDT